MFTIVVVGSSEARAACFLVVEVDEEADVEDGAKLFNASIKASVESEQTGSVVPSPYDEKPSS